VPSIQLGDTLDFTKKEAEILEDFDLFVLQTLDCLNDLLPRPEFAKVDVLSENRYEAQLEEEARLKKLNIKVKQTISENPKVMPPSARSGKSFNDPRLLDTNPDSNGLLTKAKNLEAVLYNGSEDAGTNMYRKYLGRIQVKESEKQVKELVDDNQMGVFSKSFVEKFFRVADPLNEDCYVQVRNGVRRVLAKHLAESRRVLEFFDQVQPLIKGQLEKKVRDFVLEDRKEHLYEQILKELRWHEKIVLQLPSVVFFPLFEVGTNAVKEELLRRTQTLAAAVFRKYESTTAAKAQTVCDKYAQICRFLDKQLRTPADVVEMDRFKNNLLLEIGNLQEKSRDIRDRALFLLRQDKVYEADTWVLVKQLHEWPDKMNAHMDASDERHLNERQNIENAV